MAKADTEEQLSESYISVGLGLLVVVVVGILLYNYFTQKGNKSAEEKTSEAEKIAQELLKTPNIDTNSLFRKLLTLSPDNGDDGSLALIWLK